MEWKEKLQVKRLLLTTRTSFSVEMSPINLNRIQEWINAGRLDPTKPITLNELADSRCLHGVKDGVKLLARGKEELTTPINIIVSRASAEAIEAVEKLGGTVTTRFYTPFAIRKIRGGEMDPIHSLQSRIQMAPVEAEGAEAAAEALLVERSKYPFRLPDPTSRKDLEYYRDAAHRGYLSHMVEEGHGPSLFFKTPGAGRVDRRKVTSKGGKSVAKAENRVW
jgi:large subunit ribosomal protein L15